MTAVANLGLGEILQLRGWINRGELRRALALQRRHGGRLGSAFLELSAVTERQLTTALMEQSGLPEASVDDLRNIPGEVLALVPRALMRRCRALPFRLRGGVLDVAMEDPRNVHLQNEIAFASGKKVRLHVTPEVRLYEALAPVCGLECPPRFARLLNRLDRERRSTPEPRRSPSMPPRAEAPRRTGTPGKTLDFPRVVTRRSAPAPPDQPADESSPARAAVAPILQIKPLPEEETSGAAFAEAGQSGTAASGTAPSGVAPSGTGQGAKEQPAAASIPVQLGQAPKDQNPTAQAPNTQTPGSPASEPEPVDDVKPGQHRPSTAQIELTAQERQDLLEDDLPLSELPVELRLRRATQAQEVGEALLDHLAPRYARVALLRVRGEILEGWLGAGEGFQEQRFKSFKADFRRPSTFLSLYHGVSFFTGPLPPLEIHRSFLASWDGRRPLECAIVPVRPKRRLVCLVYVDRCGPRNPPLELGALRDLAEEASKAFMNCILRNRLLPEQSRKTV